MPRTPKPKNAMFFRYEKAKIRTTDALLDAIEAMPTWVKTPVLYEHEGNVLRGEHAVVKRPDTGEYGGTCGADFGLVQHKAAFEPLVEALAGHEFGVSILTNGPREDIFVGFKPNERNFGGLMRVTNSCLPGPGLRVSLGAVNFYCTNGAVSGALAAPLVVRHTSRVEERLRTFHEAMTLGSTVVSRITELYDSVSTAHIDAEEVVKFYLGLGLPVRDILDSVEDPMSHLFGPQRLGGGWTLRRALDVATHVISETATSDADWNKVQLVCDGVFATKTPESDAFHATVKKGDEVLVQMQKKADSSKTDRTANVLERLVVAMSR